MCSCRGPSTCKQGRRLYKRCSCKQWPCTYTAPCVARTCWEESQTHIAATLWQRRSTHPARALMHAANAPRRGEIMHRSAAPHPAAAPATERPAPPAHLRSERPAASRTHAAHTHTAQIRHPAAHAGSCAAPAAPHDQAPQTARKPARLSSRTGFFFCMMEPDAARRKRLGRTTQPDRRPHCPLHPYSAGEISHRSGKERTTSTTTAPRPTRAGPHWKTTTGPAGSSNHHAHDQTAYAPAARPVHIAPVLVMGKLPGGHCPTHSSHTQTARKSRSLNRPAHTAGHQKQGTV